MKEGHDVRGRAKEMGIRVLLGGLGPTQFLNMEKQKRERGTLPDNLEFGPKVRYKQSREQRERAFHSWYERLWDVSRQAPPEDRTQQVLSDTFSLLVKEHKMKTQ